MLFTRRSEPATPELLKLLDRRGYYRSPVAMPGYAKGRVAPNKGMKLPAEPLTRREVMDLLATCNRGPSGRRDEALIVVMWRAGLRVAEALALYPKDVDLEHGTIRVLHGKGNRARTVGLDRMACSIVERWIEVRRQLEMRYPAPPLFCVISSPCVGAPIHTGNVREMLKRRARAAGIEKRVHPHGLRHTHAFELAEEKFPLPYIQRQLGHNSLSVTARYIDHLNPLAVMEAVRAREWGEGRTPDDASPRS